jgi:hypothetical protein
MKKLALVALAAAAVVVVVVVLSEREPQDLWDEVLDRF